MASAIAAHAAGGWARELLGDSVPQEFDLRMWCDEYMQAMGCCRRAYDAHRGRKMLVTYEQLVAEPVHTLGRIYDGLEIALSEQELAEAVQKHSWANIPEDQKGAGMFQRKASPGSWREDLSEDQIAVIEDITAPILREFYSER